jgi:hypothetical protein
MEIGRMDNTIIEYILYKIRKYRQQNWNMDKKRRRQPKKNCRFRIKGSQMGNVAWN